LKLNLGLSLATGRQANYLSAGLTEKCMLTNLDLLPAIIGIFEKLSNQLKFQQIDEFRYIGLNQGY